MSHTQDSKKASVEVYALVHHLSLFFFFKKKIFLSTGMTGVHYHAGVRAQSFHVYPVPYNVATLGQVNKLHLAIHLKTKRTQNALCPVNYRQSTQIERRKESPGIF